MSGGPLDTSNAESTMRTRPSHADARDDKETLGVATARLFSDDSSSSGAQQRELGSTASSSGNISALLAGYGNRPPTTTDDEEDSSLGTTSFLQMNEEANILLPDFMIRHSVGDLLSTEPPQPDEASVDHPPVPSSRSSWPRPIWRRPNDGTLPPRGSLSHASDDNDSEDQRHESSESPLWIMPTPQDNEAGDAGTENDHDGIIPVAPVARSRCRRYCRLGIILPALAVLALLCILPLAAKSRRGGDDLDLLEGGLVDEEEDRGIEDLTTLSPTTIPSHSPSLLPSFSPTTAHPTDVPSVLPSAVPTVTPSLVPSSSPTQVVVLMERMILTELPATGEKFADPTSPQSQALEWLADNPGVGGPSRWLQRFGLATLYYSTQNDDATWTSSLLWLQDGDECVWQHVRCDRGQVTGLQLEEQGLTGNLPAELGLVLTLQHLNLAKNPGLSGNPFPDAWTLLKNLREVNMSRNRQLVGTLPPFVGGWRHLQLLNLFQTGLVGAVPSSLLELSELRFLDLSETALMGVPEALCDGSERQLQSAEVLKADCYPVYCPCCTACCFYDLYCVGNNVGATEGYPSP